MSTGRDAFLTRFRRPDDVVVEDQYDAGYPSLTWEELASGRMDATWQAQAAKLRERGIGVELNLPELEGRPMSFASYGVDWTPEENPEELAYVSAVRRWLDAIGHAAGDKLEAVEEWHPFDEDDGLTLDPGPLLEAALAGARLALKVAGIGLGALVLAGVVVDYWTARPPRE